MKDLHDYLVARDGSVSRTGKAMFRMMSSTGYSVESLRSFAYGRRKPRDTSDRAKKLKRILARDAAKRAKAQGNG